MLRSRWLMVCLLILSGAPLAAEEAPAPPDPDEVRYVPLQPAFVVNFGVADRGRLQFVKADIAVRVTGSTAAAAARYHLPALRNSLVLLLSRQDEGSVSTGSGRESIRAQALAELQGILAAEEGQSFIEEVLFTNFIVQR